MSDFLSGGGASNTLSCQFCGQPVEASSTYCWGCNRANPVGKAKRSGSGGGNKVVLIVVLAVAALGVVGVGASYLLPIVLGNTSVLPNTTPTHIHTPMPTPTEDDGISKQGGN